MAQAIPVTALGTFRTWDFARTGFPILPQAGT